MMGTSDPFSGLTEGHRGRRIMWEGHDLIELESREIAVTVSLTRGAEFLEIRDKATDVDILWHGHDDIRRNRVAPASIDLPAGAFLDHFAGGWQVVFPSAQFPTTVRGAPLGQHGEAALLPWHLDRVFESAGEVGVDIHVDMRRLPVRMTRQIRLRSRQLTITDTIENRSAQQLPVQWGHHLAVGGLMAEPGTTVILPEGAPVTVPDEFPSDTYRYSPGLYAWPLVSDRHGESVRVDRLPLDDGTDGHFIIGPLEDGRIEVRSPAAGLEMLIEWDATVMPYCWIWEVFGGYREWPLWGKYRLFTVEPFTSPLEPLEESAAAGRALVLGSQDTKMMTTSMTLRPTAGEHLETVATL